MANIQESVSVEAANFLIAHQELKECHKKYLDKRTRHPKHVLFHTLQSHSSSNITEDIRNGHLEWLDKESEDLKKKATILKGSGIKGNLIDHILREGIVR